MKRETKLVKEQQTKAAKPVKETKAKQQKPVKEKPAKQVKEKPAKQVKEKPVKEKKGWWIFGKKKNKEVPAKKEEIKEVLTPTEEVAEADVPTVELSEPTIRVETPVVEEKVLGSTKVLVSGFIETTLKDYANSIVKAVRKVTKEVTPLEVSFSDVILPLIDSKSNSFCGNIKKYKKASVKLEMICEASDIVEVGNTYEVHIPAKHSMLMSPRVIVLAKEGEKPFVSEAYLGRGGKTLFGVAPFSPDEVALLSVKPVYEKEK